MIKNKKILLIISFLIITMIVGCSNNSNATNKKVEKLPLSEANIKKVFKGKYSVVVHDSNSKSISADFRTSKDIPRSKAKETLKGVESTLHKNFNINTNNSIITIYSKASTLVIQNGKIQIGEAPAINLSAPILYDSNYSMSTTFNLLNPFLGIHLTATDTEDGDLTNKIKLQNPQVLTQVGEQTLIYEVTDSDGNTATETLKITVTK